MKKYVKYFLVEIDSISSYRKLESDLPFSTEEAMDYMKEKNPTAKNITPIAKSKAELFLGLNECKKYLNQ